MKGISFIFVVLFVTLSFGHIQDLTRRAVQSESGENREDISYHFNNPIQIGGEGYDNAGAEDIQYSRFIHNFIPKNEYDVYSFTVTKNSAIVVAMPWVKACRKYQDRYLHIAFLGPLSDSRFQLPTSDFRRQWGIDWTMPAGYGAVWGIHPEVPRGEVRPTVNITLPEGEFPDAYFIPYNSGEKDPESIAFQQYQRNPSTGIMGCTQPPERCPGAPYPFNQTSPFCPHYKVGDFCGPKPWRWIKEREVRNGKYYFVVWEQDGKEVDYAQFLGFDETLRMGRLNTTYCMGFPPSSVPSSCTCGTKSQLTLPEGCIALYPTSRLRSQIVYKLVVDGNTLHNKCEWVDNAPKYNKRNEVSEAAEKKSSEQVGFCSH